MKNWKTLEIHSLAQTLPEMPEPEFLALKRDIAENGLQEPIVLFQGKVLDGRHRFLACKGLVEEGMLRQPHSFREFNGTDQEALAFVASLNMLRRHLSKSQKAMVLVMAGFVAPPGSPGRRRKHGMGREAIMEVGRKYGVNHMTLYKAAYVHARDESLAQQVVKGEYSVPAAEKLIRTREAQQQPLSNEAKKHLQIIGEIEAFRKFVAKAEVALRTAPHRNDILSEWKPIQAQIQKCASLLQTTVFGGASGSR